MLCDSSIFNILSALSVARLRDCHTTKPFQNRTILFAFHRARVCVRFFGFASVPRQPSVSLRPAKLRAFNFGHPCPSLVKGEVLSPEKIRATTGGIATSLLPKPHYTSKSTISLPPLSKGGGLTERHKLLLCCVLIATHLPFLFTKLFCRQDGGIASVASILSIPTTIAKRQ